jgi:hypothetical protein
LYSKGNGEIGLESDRGLTTGEVVKCCSFPFFRITDRNW